MEEAEIEIRYFLPGIFTKYKGQFVGFRGL